ncbi:MAG: hypothetical protein ACOY5V_01095 [Pseudomonadota bacterium]
MRWQVPYPPRVGQRFKAPTGRIAKYLGQQVDPFDGATLHAIEYRDRSTALLTTAALRTVIGRAEPCEEKETAPESAAESLSTPPSEEGESDGS